MKKLLLGSMLLMVGLGVFAQAHTGYVAILPGWQFNTGSYQVADGYFRANAKGQDGFIGSLDAGWFFTDHVGIHGGYVYDEGKYDFSAWYGPYYLGKYDFRRNVSLVEVGPEFLFGTKTDEGYFQLNLGHTFGSGTTWFYYNGSRYDIGNIGSNEWTYGAAIGYRHYFNQSVGLAIQGAYHHISNWDINDMWDARVGVSFKF